MVDDILITLLQVATLFIMMAVGILLSRFKMVDAAGVKQMTKILLYVVMPCVMINAFEIEFDKEKLTGIFIMLLCSVLSLTAAIIISLFFFTKSENKNIYRFSIVYSNCGFLAIPLTNAIVGEEGVFYAIIYLVVFQIFSWTHGVVLMSGDKKLISLKNIFINPGIIGAILATIIFVFSIKLPFPISESIRMIKDINTPLAMIVIGVSIAGMNISSMLRNKKLYFASSLRLLVIPVITMVILFFLPIPPVIFITVMIPVCAPTAATIVLFAANYNKDTVLGSQVMTCSIIFSIITMSIIIGTVKILSKIII